MMLPSIILMLMLLANTIQLTANTLCFTYCQIPIVYKIANQNSIEIVYNDNSISKFNSLEIDEETSKKVFKRTGQIKQIIVNVIESDLK